MLFFRDIWAFPQAFDYVSGSVFLIIVHFGVFVWISMTIWQWSLDFAYCSTQIFFITRFSFLVCEFYGELQYVVRSEWVHHKETNVFNLEFYIQRSPYRDVQIRNHQATEMISLRYFVNRSETRANGCRIVLCVCTRNARKSLFRLLNKNNNETIA